MLAQQPSPTIEDSETTALAVAASSRDHSPRIQPQSSPQSRSGLPAYGSDFAAALYSAYPPEKKELGMRGPQQQQASPQAISDRMSYHSDVVKGT